MMKMRRFLALMLSLCMVLSLAPLSVMAAEPTQSATDLSIEQLDNSQLDVDLTQESIKAEDLALEQEMVDENGMIEVFIVMEGESIIEEDTAAVLNTETEEKAAALEEAQAEVVAEIEDTVLDGETLEIEYSYTWLFNGVAAQIPYDAMADIAAIDGVKQVVVQPIYEIFENEVTRSEASPMTVSDGVMVGRENTWAAGYTGKGIKIAVIDTGLDTDHQNFAALPEEVLTADSATRETVEAVLPQLKASTRYEGLTIDDVYYSTKVAFGFNYSDDNLDITHANDQQGDHGTHVAGIAAANKVEESAVVGVAPDAQLYILKVFGGTRAGYGSDIIAALEDALILGADVVNMSLGSNGGFTTSADEFVNSIYARVAETNTVLSISAGNNYTSGFANLWGTDLNTTSNPDNAIIGEPGVYQNVLSVASVENWKIERNYIQVSDGYQMGYVETSASYGLPALTTLTESYGIVAVPGSGEPADYEGLDVTGKVALVQRGVISFGEKAQNAEAAGAIACMVYNNTTGEIYMDLTDCTATIPTVSITMADGQYLADGTDLTVSFPTDTASIPSETAYEMSEFSSWGVAPDLSLEPDITAPGGNIYSTIDDGQYGLMSGTSMAAPNVSGLSALVMQYAKENCDTDDYREMVQNLLVSTSSPLSWGEDTGLYYAPRSQGSGLANAFNAVTTQVYLTVDGMDSPKAELGQDPERTGAYSFTYDVHNFGDTAAYYALNTVTQSEGVVAYDVYEGTYFMSGTPMALSAATAESSDALVLTHDVDSTGAANSHDAYLIYQAAVGNAESDWQNISFRYDVNRDDAVTTDDVQAYLDALVGNDSAADLADQSLEVEAGESVSVDVSVTLDADSKAYLDTYYENGGYVEGFTFLTARNAGGVDLSLPYLGFYGDWNDAPILDDGNYWDLLNSDGSEVIGNQYYNVLFTNFQGQASYAYPGMNVYLDEAYDLAHLSVSPNNDGYMDTVDDIYTSLLRNAATLTYRYTNTETGEVYYDQTVLNVSKTAYNASYGQIIPNVYTWYEGEIALYDWMAPDGSQLANNTQLLLEIEATGAYEGATPDTWAVPITIDLEAPQLLSATRVENTETGAVTLELTFKDNLSVSAVGLLSGDTNTVYDLQPTVDTAPDAEGYRNYTATFDITGISDKLIIMLGDYAANESYYGLNAGGEGTPYGSLVGYAYSTGEKPEGWVSFDTDVAQDEVTVFLSDMNVVAAEYVAGFVFAQTDTGALYGFPYADMLLDSFDLESTYIAQLDYVYQDLAYSYVEGKLLGLLTYVDDGYPSCEINSINLKGAYFDEDMWMDVAPYQEDWFANRGGVYGLAMAIDDAGTIYIVGPTYDWDTEDLSETASLWAAQREVSSDSWGTYVDYIFQNVGDTGLTMDFLQSMTWDHNTEKLYWARFNGNAVSTVSELIEIDPTAVTENEDGTTTVSCTTVGTLSGETCGLFAPLTAESAAREEHANVPEMDTSVVGTPILRDATVTMNITGTKTLAYDLDPWYTDHKDVVWSSNDESVAVVDQNGTVLAVGTGSAVITVAAKDDEAKFDTCTVEVTALDLVFEGIVSAQDSGVGNVSDASTYKFEMVSGLGSFNTVNTITASEELNYGLSLATSAMGRGSIWATEYGNTGMIYQINPANGEVTDVLMPMDGDMLFGLEYSEATDSFTGIMNMYLYADLALTHEEEQLVMDSYDEELHEYTYHKLNMLPYLEESNTGFVTGETGQGASTEIVFSAITTVDGGIRDSYGDTFFYDTYKDYMGNWAYEGSVNYQPTQTLILLDNVGRLWYVDEVRGLTKTTDEYGNAFYTGADEETYIEHYGQLRNGMMELEYDDGTCTIYNIRQIVETPLTTMFREGSMPRITYHFSDIAFTGYTAEGDPVIAMSLYDYWNNGTTNELFLFIPGHATEDWDDSTNDYVRTADRLYSLGNTGKYNIIASIHSAIVTGGVDKEVGTVETPADEVTTLAIGSFNKKSAN